jgi:type I restriction enzyme, S subunit
MIPRIPTGWVSVELEDHVYIAGRIGWRGLKSSEYTASGPRLLAVKNIRPNGEVDCSDTDHISIDRYDESPEIQLRWGDILLTKDGAGIGKVGMLNNVSEQTTVNSSILVVRPKDGLLLGRYLFHFLRGPQFQTIARERIAGSAIPHLFQKDIKKLRALVPPLNEQSRIARRLEELLAKVDSCQNRLAKIPVLLKRFREAVLAAACSGDLTADWRENNANAEPYLIQYVDGPLLDGHDCPKGWRIINLGALLKLVTSGSRGWAKYYSKSGTLFIRAQNINSDVLDLKEAAYVQLPDRSEGIRTKVQLHDILITITGANVTRSALVQKQIEEAYVNQHVALVRLSDVRLSKFIFLFVISPMHGRQQLSSSAYGQGKPGLNLDNIRRLILALPPLSEQQEIVRCVDELFAVADQVEARYAKAKQHVDSLKQSILAKAFRGELVPQDPNDEPATVLLERIRKVCASQHADRSKQKVERSMQCSTKDASIQTDNKSKQKIE